MRVVRPHVRLQGQVQQLAVEVLLLLLQRDVLVFVHRREERPGPGEAVPGVVEVGRDRVRGSSVGRQEGAGGLHHQGSGVVDIRLRGEPSNWIHLAGKMIILIIR